MIIGRLKGQDTTTVQAYRFPIDLYTAAEAKAWLKENDVKYIAFEEATGEEESINHAAEIIRKEGDKWILYSHDGSKKLGEFDTKEEAEEREREIQAFKHMESQEAVSLDEITRKVRDAWHAKFDRPHIDDIYRWPREVLDDQVIVEMPDGLYSYPYTISGEGDVEFGEPSKVEVIYTKVSEYFYATLIPHATEAEEAQFEGREWDVTIIGADSPDDLVEIEGTRYLKSKNGRLYALDALRESTPNWDGVQVYDNHLTDEEFKERGGMRSVVKELIGALTAPEWTEKPLPGIKAVLRIIDKSVAEKLKAAWDAGVIKKALGLSVDTFPTYGDEVTLEGKRWPTIEGFGEIVSTDLVAKPAAGGGFNRLIAAQTTSTEVNRMDEQKLKELIARLVSEALADKKVGDEQKEALQQAIFSAALGAKVTEAEDPEAEVKKLVGALIVQEATPTPEPEPEPVPEPAQPTEPEPQPDVQEQIRRLECQITLRDKLDAAKLRPKTRGLIESIYAGTIFKEADLDAAIKRAKEADADNDPSGRVQGAGASRVSVGLNEQDVAELEFFKLAMGLSAFRELENAQEHFVTERITESYRGWIKAGRPSNIAHGRPIYRFSEWCYELLGGNPLVDDRAYEAITTSGMSSIVKNAVNVMLAADYAKRDRWWDPIVTTEEVETIDQATLVRVYGMNSLSVVNEGQAYTELDWVDQEETAAFVKKGNYVGITLESLLRDKVNVIRRLPARLSTSWYNTLSDLVAGVFTVNTNTGPAMSGDGTSAALFNSTAVTTQGGHANLLTTALSFTAFGSARTAMRKQTDQYSGGGTEVGRRMLVEPKFLLVPVDLETTANQIRNSEREPGTADNDMNPYYQKFEVVVVPPWTDATDWALVADPVQFPAIWLIFLRGQQVPQIFTAGDESSGAMFTNDTLRYKVRMMTWRFSSTYDCAPVSDWRPLHKSNV